jgi:membrane dipeptidase
MGRVADSNAVSGSAAGRILANSLVWDNHVSVTIGPERSEWLRHLKRHKEAGVDVISLNVGFDAFAPANKAALLAEFRRWFEIHSGDYQLVSTVKDIHRARLDGKLAVCFNMEGGRCLYGQVSMVSFYYDLGVRWMLFSYNRNNELAGGCQDDDQGLTAFGREVLKEMERVGMVVCCSHLGHRSAMEIMEAAVNPVIFSHSNARALCEHSRNVTNEAIRACAQTGGVIGITGLGNFLGVNDIRAQTFVRHVDHVVNLVGAEHVGIALDCHYDDEEIFNFVKKNPQLWPPEEYPDGLAIMQPEQIPEIAELLLRLGYRESDVVNIMGGNHLRIAQRVWK